MAKKQTEPKKNPPIEDNDPFLYMRGNQWHQLRNKIGRDKIFNTPEALWNAACDYFEWCEENPMIEQDFVKTGQAAGNIVLLKRMRPFTIKNMCRFLGCHSIYFHEFEQSVKDKTDEKNAAFSKICTYIREIIEDQKYQGAAVGFFNATIIARDLGLMDRVEQKHSIDESVTEQFRIGDKVITFGNTLR